MILRQSTSQVIRFGQFVDSTDGATAETALTIAQADMQLSKDGGAFAQKNAAGNATHDADGWYSTTLNATDTNTVGELILQVNVTGALYVTRTFYVVEEAVYDAFYAGSAAGIPSIPANWITAAGINADAITAAKVAADVHTEAADAVWDELQSGHVTAGSMGEIATEIASILVDTGTTLDAAIATIDSNVDAILVDTGTSIPADIAALNDLSAADVNAEVDTALADIHLDHLLAVDYDPATKPGVATALFNELIEDDGGVSRFTVNALEQGPSGSGASASAIADAVWDELQADHVTAGSFGEVATEVASILVDTGTTLDGKLDTIDSNVDAILLDTNELQTDDIPGLISALNDPTAAAIADAVWDETQASHITAGSMGEIATEIASILTDTNELQTDDIPGLIAALNDVSSADVNAACDTALADYDAPTKAELDAGFAALNDLSAAAVNAEVDTALADIHLDHLLAADYDPASKPGIATALLNELVEDDAGVSRFTTNALEQGPSGSGASAATIADAVWDELQADHVTVGSMGIMASELASVLVDTDTTIPALIAALNDLSAVQVNAEVDTALSDYDAPTKAELDSGLAALNDPTAATIADAVWDELQADHVTVGSMGVLGSEIASILVDTDTTIPALIAALNDVSSADVNAACDTALSDYDAPTKAELDAGFAALNDLSAAAVNAEVDTALTDYDAPTKAELDSAIAALNDIAASDVLTQVNAALDTAIAELGVAAPTATPTVRTGLMLLYMAARNKVDVTATTKEVHNDAGTVIATKTLSDDGTTYSESEMV